jgi:hypothetical protein
LILSVQPLLFDGFVVDDGVPSSKGSTEFLPLRLLEPGLLSIRADRFPFKFAVLNIPKIVLALRMVLRLAVDNCRERFQFAVSCINWIDVKGACRR